MKNFANVAASALAVSLCMPLAASAQSKSVTHHATMRTHTAHTNAAGFEGIAPFSNVFAYAEFTDDGTTLTINGRGGGFNPGLSYTSFFYGVGSVPRGALACFPPTPNNLTATQMITGYWLPVGSSNRTLYIQKTGASYVSLPQVATFSVRYDSTPTLPLTTNLNPGRFWLDSCGAILQ